MKLKLGILLVLCLTGIAFCMNWTGDATQEDMLQIQDVPPELRQKAVRFLGALSNYCAKEKYSQLERQAFGVTPIERAQALESTGVDPVTASLELLQTHSAGLDWEKATMQSYRNAPWLDVTIPTKGSGSALFFRINCGKNGNLRLASVEIAQAY